MRIDVLCNDGSPLGVSMNDLWGEGQRGIGLVGSEYGLLTLCEEWTKRGNRVRLYNDPRNPRGNPFGQYPIGSFQSHEERDILIIFRSPNERITNAKGLKIWFSTDQYTVGDFAKFAPKVDKIVCISPFHANYFRNTYGIENTIVIDLPIRVYDLDAYNVGKHPKRMIFTSVPDRGLHIMRDAWKTIKKKVPEASLVITSDYRLWGLHEPRNERFRAQWIGEKDVIFLGAIKRGNLIEEQLKADLFVYPCNYSELFCVSLAEAQACGVYPITSNIGALATTNMGTIVKGNPEDSRSGFMKQFCDEVVNKLNDPQLSVLQERVKDKSIERFSPQKILNFWDELVFKHG